MPEGKVISNKPKNEKAKVTNKRKKIKLGIQCVLSTLAKSALLVIATIAPIKV